MEINASKLWGKILKLIEREINEVEYNTFFKNVEVGEISEGALTVWCTTNLVKQNVEKYKETLEENAEIITDEKIEITFKVKVKEIQEEKEYRFSEQKLEKYKRMNTGLNEKNRLDNFVVGNNSRLAFNACLAVVENELPVYNPLLIYGGSGLGKTHLIQAVGNAILERYPYKKVFYSTSEEFSNTFFQVLQRGEVQEFREVFRSLDVLLLDDIQFFEKVFGEGRGTIEEEFFHTFNKLQDMGKQIIMISDRYPKEIKNLSKRMESRFLSGLSVEMQQPPFETRYAILKRLSDAQNIEIDKNILEYIADNVDSNVRELEGILTSMGARAKLLHEKITLQQVQDELAGRIRKQRAEITAEKIIETVSVEFDVSVSDMKSKKRQKKIVEARQIAMFLLKSQLDLNLTKIGGLFGGKDHSTVISSIRKIEARINDSRIFKGEIDRVKQSISK